MRGKEELIPCCCDSDVVDIGKDGGGDFEEEREKGRKGKTAT